MQDIREIKGEAQEFERELKNAKKVRE